MVANDPVAHYPKLPNQFPFRGLLDFILVFTTECLLSNQPAVHPRLSPESPAPAAGKQFGLLIATIDQTGRTPT